MEYSVPFLWGITGIFYNKKYFNSQHFTKWSDLWQPDLYNQLMLLDDAREVFSMALLALGYPVNDKNPEHIHQAYLKLKTLMPNVRVFSSDTVVSIMIDDDATIGMAWNGDTYKASLENKAVNFVFPKEGFVIWVDNFAIPKSAPHKNNAYKFINFMLRADIAKAIALYTHYPTTNQAGQQLLPEAIRNNETIYPPANLLRKGQFQTDLDDKTLELYEKYWELLKMGG